MIEDPAISVIGLGKLGAPIAACFARKYSHVIGIDNSQSVIEQVNKGQAPVLEPGLDILLKENHDRIRATNNYREAILETDITFVVVPTPSENEGGFSLEFVLDACRQIGGALSEKDGYHLVVLTSTVLPGATENEVKPFLEKNSGKRCGADFGLCYSPEFIALGSVIRDFLNPDFVLIGESDSRAGDMLESVYKATCDNDPKVARMNCTEAELTKLAVNTFITTKITFANTLARMCERLPGARVDAVTSALGLDSRIGYKYLKGAIGYGGPCFPRDNIAFSFLAKRLGVPDQLANATDEVNRKQAHFLLGLVESKLPERGVVGILGLTYKADTCVIEESQGLLLALSLIEDGVPICVFDPMGLDNARRELEGRVRFAAGADECARESDIIVIATPWEEFRNISPEALQCTGPPKVIVDCWRLLDPEEYKSIAHYIELGVWRRNSEEE